MRSVQQQRRLFPSASPYGDGSPLATSHTREPSSEEVCTLPAWVGRSIMCTKDGDEKHSTVPWWGSAQYIALKSGGGSSVSLIMRARLGVGPGHPVRASVSPYLPISPQISPWGRSRTSGSSASRARDLAGRPGRPPSLGRYLTRSRSSGCGRGKSSTRSSRARRLFTARGVKRRCSQVQYTLEPSPAPGGALAS